MVFQPISLIYGVEKCIARMADVKVNKKFTILEGLWVLREGISEDNTDQSLLTV